jgi:hypothetical protein
MRACSYKNEFAYLHESICVYKYYTLTIKIKRVDNARYVLLES